MITVHVGAHKTGTSAIQSALAMVTHRRGLLISGPEYTGTEFDAAWAGQVRAEGQRRHVIVSSEGLLGDPFVGYDDAPDRARELRAALGSDGVRVVLYLRPQSEWVPSIYLQAVQQGGTADPETFWDGIRSRRHLRWASLVDSLAQVFPGEGLVVRPYVSGTDVVEDFFATTGLGRAPVVSGGAVRENVSISAAQAPIMRALNADASLTREQRVRIRSFFQTVVGSTASARLSPLPEGIQDEISLEFEGDWEDVAARLGSGPGAADFRTAAPRPSSPKAYAEPLRSDDPAVAELLRIVGDLALRDNLAVDPSAWQRVLSKARSNPRDLPSALVRKLQRHGR